MLRLVFLSALISLVFTWEPRFHLGRRKFGFRVGVEQDESQPGETMPNIGGFSARSAIFTQKLDHFNDNDNRTWAQRYFVNDQFANGKVRSVAFLNLGGEGKEDISWVENENLPWLQWAQDFGAIVYSLEHRFYGESKPFPTQSVENLQYLTSRQALADAAEFITQMQRQPKLLNSTWIVFGGFYSGALALWLRQEYPYLVNGAVGSSAPLQAVIDFYQYLQVVQTSLGNEAVGGGSDCVDRVRDGFAAIVEKMNTAAGRLEISDKFQLDPSFDELEPPSYNDIQNFYSTLIGNFQNAVQYSGNNAGPYKTGYGIADVCEKMTSAANALDGIAAVNVYMSTMGTGNISTFESTPNNYTDMIDYLRIETFNLTDDPSFDSGARSWTWQTCSEAFGFYQTTDVLVDTIFGPITPLNLFINICQDVFGPQFTATSIAKAVDATNAYYGGARGYRGTNVVIPNGSLDPWHALGALETYNYTDTSVVTYMINNTAHCADMYPENGTDTQPGIIQVHALIKYHLDNWINGPASNRTTGGASDSSQASVIQPIRAKRSSSQPIVFAAVAASEPAKAPGQYAKFHLGRPPGGLRPAVSNADDIDVEVAWFPQPVDHFDNRNTATYKQRVWTNAKFSKPGGPRFLMLGGESEESSKWVSNANLTWLTYAQQLGATAYLIEHRYYGESKVNADIKFLTSLQALHDARSFILRMNSDSGESSPWIVFGGSYSGALALWMRQLFPDLVAGAVGSSGPIQAKLDFYEYLEVVEASIRSYSDECADNIGLAFNEIHNLIQDTAGVTTLNEQFNLEPPFDATNYPLTETHKQYFFQNIYGNFQGAVQYSGDNTGAYANSYGIPFMCSFMLNNSLTPLNNTVNFNVAMTEFYTNKNFTTTDNDYEAFVEYLQVGGPANEDAAMRYWTWQTCNEFGYFQSSDLGQGIFGSPTPVNLFTQLCKDVFWNETDIDVASYISAAVETTNKRYGGRDNYRGTNVVIPNGSLDPWHALGKFEGSISNGSSIIYINGTAHCADMYPARDPVTLDPPSLVAARAKIGEFVSYWVNGGDEPDPVNPDQTTPTPGGTTPAGGTETTTKSASAVLCLVPIVLSFLL